MLLYTWESEVKVGMLGAVEPGQSAHARIEVHGDGWNGTLELPKGGRWRLQRMGVFLADDGETYPFDIQSVSRESLVVAPNHAVPPPGRRYVREASGVVEVLAHGRVVERGLANVRVLNDESWEADVLLEGNGSFELADGTRALFGIGDRFNVRSLGTDLAVTARVMGVDLAWVATASTTVCTLFLERWAGSPPPL